MNLFTTHKLPGKIMHLLKGIGGLAGSNGYKAFIVGGTVRDLILGSEHLDLDMVVEGDAIKFGRMLAEELCGNITAHRRFGTCSIVMKDGLRMDLATARKETYESPGALPKVEFSSIKDDLIRRDFTINAMAASINKSDFGRLIDFSSGREDLKSGRIRALHDKSFIDDPTRIFRAIRLEQRFGFRIDTHTSKLMEEAIERGMLEKLQTERVRKEVLLILKENDPMKVLERLGDFIHAKALIKKVCG